MLENGMCISAVTVQDPEAGIVPPDMPIVVLPGAALTTPPTQVVDAAGVEATVNPAPIVVRLSVSDVTVMGAGVLFVSVIVAGCVLPAYPKRALPFALPTMTLVALNGAPTTSVALEPE